MRYSLIFALMGLMVCCSSLIATAQEANAEAIEGKWEIIQEFGGSETFSELEVKKADGVYTARLNGQELASVKFENNDFSFVRTFNFGGQDSSINFSGKLADGKITGQFEGGFGAFDVEAIRPKPLSQAVGAWRISINLEGTDFFSRLIISQKNNELTGKLISETSDETNTISNVTFNNGTLEFKRKAVLDEITWETTFKGAIEDGELSGAFVDSLGNFPIRAEKIGANFIGKWELTGDFQFGGNTRILQVLPDLSVRYQMFEGLTAIEKTTIDKNKITFEVETGFGENTFTMKFDGTLTGNKLDGEIGVGEFLTAVTGKKIG